MAAGRAVWSFRAPDRAPTSSLELHSLCKHAPLRSIAPAWPPLDVRDRAVALQRRRLQQQRQQPAAEHAAAAPAAARSGAGQLEDLQQQQQLDLLVQWQEQSSSAIGAAAGAAWPEQQAAGRQQHSEQAFTSGACSPLAGGQLGQDAQWPWHVVLCCAAQPLSGEQQGLLSPLMLDQRAAANGLSMQRANRAGAPGSGAEPPLSQQQEQQQQQQQPEPLHRLICAVKRQPPPAAGEAAVLLRQLRPLLQLLPFGQLAQVAWAASRLVAQQPAASRAEWRQLLLAAARRHFGGEQQCGGAAEAATATLLQALATMQAEPGAAWLEACCDGMAVAAWRSPRALSTVAACLPQLGHVPGAGWARAFFAAAGATAGDLEAWPPTSLARAAHGVAAWRHLQQQSGAQQLLHVPDAWLLGVARGLVAHSAQLKPAELAMALQALQRMQQQLGGAALPAGEHQQLLQALMARMTKQLPQFGPRDLTVAMHSLALLHEQPAEAAAQPGAALEVPWPWLKRVLAVTEEQLPRMDPRAQATCLAAAAQLVRPHLRRQELQAAAAAAAAASLPQQAAGHAQRQQAGRLGQPALIKPLQRWLLLQQGQEQQQQQQQQEQAAQQPPPLPLGDGETGAAGCWERWLRGFFEASEPQLHHFSAQDLTVAASVLATARTVPPVRWYTCLLACVQQQLDCMSAGQVSGVAWALGRMALLPSQHDPEVSLVPTGGWMARLYAAVPLQEQAETAAAAAAGAAAAAAEAAAAAAAVAEGAAGARPAAKVSGDARGIGACSAAELVRRMWAATACDFDPGDSWWAAAEQRLLALSAAAASGSGAPPEQPPVLPPRLLGALLQAYGGAGRPVPPSLQQQLVFDDGAVQQLLHEPPAAVGNVLRVLRGLRAAGCTPPQAWLQQLADGQRTRLAALAPGDLPQLLCCLADAGLQLGGPEHQRGDPRGDGGEQQQQQQEEEEQQQEQQRQQAPSSTAAPSGMAAAGAGGWDGAAWGDACLAACRQLLPRMAAADVSLTLWSLARLRLRPPAAWLEAALARQQSCFLDADLRSLALAVDSLGRLAYAPSGEWMGALLLATHRKVAAAAALATSAPASSRLRLVQSILQALWGLAALGASPSPRWLKLMLVTVHQQLPLLAPRHVATLLLALARMGCRPSAPFLQQLLDSLGDCTSCSALDLAHLAYAAAALRWRPSQRWVGAFLAASAGRLGGMGPRGLALAQWSLAVLRVVPPEPWRRAAMAATAERLGELDARSLGMVVWAWGRLKVHLVPLRGQPGGPHAAPQQQQQQQQQQEQAPSSGGWAARQALAQRLLAAAWALRGRYSAASLVHLLVGVAKLRLQPGQAWLAGMALQGSAEKLSALGGYELQQLVWAAAMLGFAAPPGWLRTVRLLLEVRAQQQDSTRHSAAWALSRLHELAEAGAAAHGAAAAGGAGPQRRQPLSALATAASSVGSGPP